MDGSRICAGETKPSERNWVGFRGAKFPTRPLWPKKCPICSGSGRERMLSVLHREVLVERASASPANLGESSRMSKASVDGSIVTLSGPWYLSSTDLTLLTDVQVVSLSGPQMDKIISLHLRHVRNRVPNFSVSPPGMKEKVNMSSSTGSWCIGAVSCVRRLQLHILLGALSYQGEPKSTNISGDDIRPSSHL